MRGYSKFIFERMLVILGYKGTHTHTQNSHKLSNTHFFVEAVEKAAGLLFEAAEGARHLLVDTLQQMHKAKKCVLKILD